jgi:predicted RNase H-like nuclease (RuvC/YqgF family)
MSDSPNFYLRERDEAFAEIERLQADNASIQKVAVRFEAEAERLRTEIERLQDENELLRDTKECTILDQQDEIERLLAALKASESIKRGYFDKIERLWAALQSVANHELRDWEDYEAIQEIAQIALNTTILPPGSSA